LSLQALRSTLVITFDAVAALVAIDAAWSIRFDGALPQAAVASRQWTLPLVVGVRVLVLVGGRLHRWSFTMPGMPEAVRILLAQVLGSVLLVVLATGLDLGVPRSIYPLELLISTAIIGGMRYGPRIVTEWHADRVRAQRRAGVRTIIAGAGRAAELLARDVQRNPQSPYFLVGFVDDARSKQGTSLLGKPVLGRLADIPQVVSTYRVSMVLVATAQLDALGIRALLDRCSALRVRFKIIPASLLEMTERISAAALHDLSPDHLLPRDTVQFDPTEIRERVRGRGALVTGGAGSIGSEIARQLAIHGARTIVLVDMNENELYVTARLLAQDFPQTSVHAEVADIRELRRLLRLGERYRPDFVFHAAAHKHVPLMEIAPEEAIKNNVFGTRNVARMAQACGAQRFVLVSTDKAVKPTSVMGASKRLAELVVRDLARRSSSTQMIAVRFGNVLGSAGSVVPIFKKQIERGGPVTVTHPECTRYFMTIPEAVGLVLEAGLRCDGDLCVLDMGAPVRILELARHLITLAGRVPEDEIPITFTGLRPGEKLVEEVLTEEEEEGHTVRDHIRVIRSPALEPPPRFQARLAELRELAREGNTEGILMQLQRLVPSYRATIGAADEDAAIPQVPTDDIARSERWGETHAEQGPPGTRPQSQEADERA
jgi:FlaA1/EpsC-like NDP-sugar epimerase